MVFIDSARYSCPEADLSVEPDVAVLLVETLERGRTRLIPKASGAEGRFVEIEGVVDLVVECVSDSSQEKDEGLRAKYHRAGVREYWLVDAREEEISFRVLLSRPSGYVDASRDEEGFAHSEVLARKVRLLRRHKAAGLVFFRLEVKHAG
jgi:Uma2 family endonuclease